MDKISIDLIIFATIILTAYQGAKRGFFKEFMIAIGYVPYMAMLFYIINEWIQGNYSFDSALYKCSALGGLYIAYLLLIWTLSKSLRWRLESIDEGIRYIGKIFASIISGARTIYFCLLCLIAFNIHLNMPDMVKKSKFASTAQPYALKTQDYLLSNNYINNEITIYDEAFNGKFDKFGNYEHPLMTKIKNSDRMKGLLEKISKDDLESQVHQMMNRY